MAFALAEGFPLVMMQVLETTSGGSSGTLLGTMDACATPAGRRKLRDWLCRPLARVKDITARQDAVHDLMTVAGETAGRARKAFAGQLPWRCCQGHLPTQAGIWNVLLAYWLMLRSDSHHPLRLLPLLHGVLTESAESLQKACGAYKS